MRLAACWAVLGALCMVANAAYPAATFQFRSTDSPGEGLNDPTPITPEGGNPATTLGEARRKVLDEAGRVWGTLLTSTVPIIVDVSVDPLTCSTNSGTLAGAGATLLFRNTAQPTVFYPSALADSLTGMNLSEQAPETTGRSDITVVINSAVNSNAGCLQGARFYYGLDHAAGFNQPDLLQVLLHEIAHGLGFQSLTSLTTGSGQVGGDGVERFSIYDQFIFDEFLNQPWVSITAPQRLQAAARSGSLAWSGTNVNNWRNRFIAGSSASNRILLYAPATIAAGSSVSHWDTSLSPNALMEPFRNPTTSSLTDITPCAMKDMGWTVTRCIDSANTTPLAVAQSVNVVEDTPTSITLTGNDTDNDPLTFALVTQTARGTLSTVSTTAPHTTLFSPNQNATGADSFTFTVNDGTATSAPGTITINITPVNDAPSATPKTVTAQSGKATTITLSGIDVDGDALTFAVVAAPASGTINGSPPNVSYRSNAGFTGADSFTYRASDASLSSAPVTVNITVNAATGGGGGGSGGGGGATGLPLLVLLAGLLARMRMRAQAIPG